MKAPTTTKIAETAAFMASGFTRDCTRGPICPPMSTPGIVKTATFMTSPSSPPSLVAKP